MSLPQWGRKMRSTRVSYKRQTCTCYMNVGRLSADSHSTLFISVAFGINFSSAVLRMLGLNQASVVHLCAVAVGGTHKHTCTLDFTVEQDSLSLSSEHLLHIEALRWRGVLMLFIHLSFCFVVRFKSSCYENQRVPSAPSYAVGRPLGAGRSWECPFQASLSLKHFSHIQDFLCMCVSPLPHAGTFSTTF